MIAQNTQTDSFALKCKPIENMMLSLNLSLEDLYALQSYLASEGWRYHQEVVGVREFIESEHYLNAKGRVYPIIMDCLEELNEGEFDEALLTGSIGSGKSTIALYTICYQLYVLSCMKNPQLAFGLDPSSEIVIIFQSISEKLAKAVEFLRFKALVDGSPFFKKYFPYNKEIESELRFPNRIIVKPISGSEVAAIGQNVVFGIIDEINFMANIERSKKSVDGGVYDQALSLYNAINRRRKSRFMNQGRLPGILCLVSSKRFPGQFTDRKMEEAWKEIREIGRTSIYVFDKRTWDIRPENFSGDWFNIFVGDESRRPRILEDGETVSSTDRHLVTQIPVEYRGEFENDIMNALRDIAGIATLSLHPFLMDTEAVSACIGTHTSILSRTETDFADLQLKLIKSKIDSPETTRWCHVDLALTGDSAGMAVGFVTGFKRVLRGEEVETLPIIKIDFTLEVIPPKGGEINFSKIREIIYKLKEWLNIKWVSYDSFQSRDSLQILLQKGFAVGLQSMDKNNVPYEVLKTALYDGRLQIPEHPKLFTELKSLEKDCKTGKIDHPSHSGASKDISDALAGVVYGLTMRREIWVQYNLYSSIPESIRTASGANRSEEEDCAFNR